MEITMEPTVVIKLLSSIAYTWLGYHHFKHRDRMPGSCYFMLAVCSVALVVV